MIKDKIKGLVTRKGYSADQMAKEYDITAITYSRKLKQETFSIHDLILIGELTNTTLCFIDKDSKQVIETFNPEDINNPKKKI